MAGAEEGGIMVGVQDIDIAGQEVGVGRVIVRGLGLYIVLQIV